MSIIEVLFAIGVTTIGLLGAIAVFPVASAQARKGRVADAVAVAGTSAVHDFDVRGLRSPTNWCEQNSSVSVMQQYLNYLDDQANMRPANPNHNYFNGLQGFCIDPIYLSANNGSAVAAGTFPPSQPLASSLKRITLVGNRTSAATSPLPRAVAESIFRLEDDLTFERPGDRSINAVQLMDTAGVTGGTVYRRQSDGHMSWMATVVPKLDRMNAPFKDQYVLSIIVFYDRPLDDLSSGISQAEHLVSVNTFPGGGVSGGEVQLTGGHDILNKIAVNGWMLLGGKVRSQAAITAGTDPDVPVFRWYRVVDAEDISEDSTVTSRFVTLFGQDWDTSLTTGAVIVDGVTGVYEKTIRLDMTP